MRTASDDHPGTRPAEGGRRPVQHMGLDEVLLQERCEIWGAGAVRALNSPGEFVCRHRPAALCLSGGGIRSAAFALGVLQGLARRGLLSRFHYLSTVSGGGYIGAWLARWIREARDGVQEVQRELAQSAAPRPEEPAQIRRLRERTNYITPKVGIASTDSWTAIALVIRNLLLNWLLLLPALMLAALVFNLYREVFLRMPGLIAPEWTPVMLAVISLPLAFAVMEASRWLPTHAVARAKAADHSYASPPEIRWWIVGPAVAWSGLLPLALASALGRDETFASAILEPFAFGGALFSYPALCTFGGAVLGYLSGFLRAEVGDRPHYIRNLPVWLLASAMAALTLAAGVWLALRLLPFAPDAAQPSPSETEAWYRTLRLGLLVALAPLWAMMSHLLLSVIYAGFRIIPLESTAPGADRAAAARPASELDREWLARLSAAKLQMPLLWALLAIACLILPVLVLKLAAPTWQWVTGVVASASGVFAVLGGRSALTVFGPGAGPNQRQRRPSSLETMLVATAAVFGAGLLAGLAWLEFLFAKWLPLSSQLAGHVVLAALLCVLVWIASRALKVNRFSLHGLYRNRLVRAFLGAARCKTRPRQADPFTDFDGADNIRMCDLWLRPLAAAEDATARVGREDDDAPGALFPVVNLALNITGGDRLAWQERKAVSFTVTPLACGWTDSLCEDSAAARGAYVSTSEYGGNEADLGMEGTGISLGTAMTISGAAASPNMGYHSSVPVAFLLTLFNVRLGAWLPNPAHELPLSEMGRSGPRHALRPLINELLGWTDDRARYVYLSDGGHFDNLGLYEMVRRRCRFILVSDASCDPDCRFEDLGRAARTIYVDQQVRIVIQDIRIMPRGKPGPEALAFAVGEIEYPDAPTGWLIYLKPSYLLAVAPIGVRAYAEIHQEFPHESTADQWFSESQFESYRSLGESLMESLDPAGPPSRSIEEFFWRVRTAAPRLPAPVPEAKIGPQEAPVPENP